MADVTERPRTLSTILPPGHEEIGWAIVDPAGMAPEAYRLQCSCGWQSDPEPRGSAGNWRTWDAHLYATLISDIAKAVGGEILHLGQSRADEYLEAREKIGRARREYQAGVEVDESGPLDESGPH